jgi:hypothetical protein
MGKVEHISREMVGGFRKTLDFYYWRGKPCVRAWPARSKIPATPQQIESRRQFIASRADLKNIDSVMRGTMRSLCVGRSSAWLDFYTANYIRYWSTYGIQPPVVYSAVVVVSPD